jgi:hypothetical protein
VAGCIANDELAGFGAEVAVGHVNGDALLAFGRQTVGEQGQIGFTLALHASQVVLQHRLGVDQQTPDEGGFAVIDRATGDELQGIKRGIVEMADLIAVNKADGDNQPKAKRAAADYRNALHLFPPKASNWAVQVLTCSALSGMGIAEIWRLIEEFRVFTEANGFFQRQRQNQSRYWLHETIQQSLREQFYQDPQVAALLNEKEAEVLIQKQSPFHAAEDLVRLFLDSNK